MIIYLNQKRKINNINFEMGVILKSNLKFIDDLEKIVE